MADAPPRRNGRLRLVIRDGNVKEAKGIHTYVANVGYLHLLG